MGKHWCCCCETTAETMTHHVHTFIYQVTMKLAISYLNLSQWRLSNFMCRKIIVNALTSSNTLIAIFERGLRVPLVLLIRPIAWGIRIIHKFLIGSMYGSHVGHTSMHTQGIMFSRERIVLHFFPSVCSLFPSLKQ